MGNGLPHANNHPESAADIRLMDSNGASDPSRECVKKLRSFYSIETETLSLLSPLKGSFPSSSLPPLPPLPFSLLLSLPSCRFIFSGRVLDINCPASIVTGKHTVQLAQIPLLTTIRLRTTEPQVPAPPPLLSSRKHLVQESSSQLGEELLEPNGAQRATRSCNLVRCLTLPKKRKSCAQACREIKLAQGEAK